MSAMRLREAGDALDLRADLCDGWAGDLAEEWRALAAWLRSVADEAIFPDDPAVPHALAVADAILGGTSGGAA